MNEGYGDKKKYTHLRMRVLSSPIALQRLNKFGFDIGSQYDTPHDDRPEFEWRFLYQRCIKHQGVQIIVEKLAPTAMSCIA